MQLLKITHGFCPRKTNVGVLVPKNELHTYLQSVVHRRRTQMVSLRSFTDTHTHGVNAGNPKPYLQQETEILDSYWLARGILEPEKRLELIQTASAQAQTPLVSATDITAVCDSAVISSWQLDELAPQIVELSRRLIALNSLLGGNERELDIVWMVTREPRLLLTETNSIVQRLLELRTSDASEGIDIGSLVEAQPGLLLHGGSMVSTSDESADEQRQAWEHGLLSDNSTEWQRRFQHLVVYKDKYGDAHVGFRDTDDAELARWANKQRKAYKNSELEEDKIALLQSVDFEFDSEKAEWKRMYNTLCTFKEVNGHCNPMPLASSADFMLINWCSVQRISLRSGVMSKERENLLTQIAFDWTGADALS